MGKLFILLLVICCCYVSSKTLSDRDIRDNFNDVQTGMGVLLRELIKVMDENERLSNDLNKTSVEFKKLKEQNKKISHTIRTVKRMVKASKNNLLKFKDILFKNLTKEQKRMQHDLTKFVTNKYAFFAWMVYKLESQNKEQEKIVSDLRIESADHKLKTMKLEKELEAMKKKLDSYEVVMEQNKETMINKTRRIDDLQSSVSLILRKLESKEKSAITHKRQHEKLEDKLRRLWKITTATKPPITGTVTGKNMREQTKQRNSKRKQNKLKDTPDIRDYLFTTSYKLNMSDVKPDEFRTAISKYTSDAPKHSEIHMLPKLTEFDTSNKKIIQTVTSPNKRGTPKNINNMPVSTNNTLEDTDSAVKNIIMKLKVIQDNDSTLKPSVHSPVDKTLVRDNTNKR